MTGDRMNATLVRVGFAAALCTLAGACASYDPFERPADPTSPAAARVAAMSDADLDYPTWAEFPAAPQNVPTPAEIRTQVLQLEADETRLNGEVSRIVWTLGPDDGEPWAQRTRNRIDMRLAQTLDPEAMALAVAWAEQQRRRAAPPPRITD